MEAAEIIAFLTHLAAKERISASTQNQAFFAFSLSRCASDQFTEDRKRCPR